MEEYYDIYDENKKKTGKIAKRSEYTLKNGEFRLVSDVFFFNSKNELMLTRRAPNKKSGLLWEATGGSVQAGETGLEGVIRETKEEIGVDLSKKDLILFKEFKTNTLDFWRFKEIYVVKKDIDISDLVLKEDEVIDAKWVTIDEFKKMKENGEIIAILDFDEEDFKKAIEIKQRESYSYIGKIVDVKIDRPINSCHPKHGFKYELNYGYIPNTISGDNEELDAYVLGINEEVDTFKGRCIAVINRLNDDDDKLIVVPDGKDFSDEEIRKQTFFQEKFFESQIIR